MCCNWFSADNVMGTDFDLYSTYDDAIAETNAWAYCNYDDPGIGFPRDCGVSGGVGGQWNSFTASWDDGSATTRGQPAGTVTFSL